MNRMRRLLLASLVAAAALNGTLAAAEGRTAAVRHQLIVGLRLDESAARAFCGSIGLKILRKLSAQGVYLVEVKDKRRGFDAKALTERQLDSIRFIEPNYRTEKRVNLETPAAPTKKKSALKLAAAVTAAAPANPGVVAVIDTAIDRAALPKGVTLWTNPKEVPGNGVDDDGDTIKDDVNGINIFTRNGDIDGAPGHGTGVNSVIGAQVLELAGSANVVLLPVVAADQNGSALSFELADITDAINLLAEIKSRGTANISTIAVSLDQNLDRLPESLLEAVKNAGKANILVVAAAGDDKQDNDGAIKAYPASLLAGNMLSVAAINAQKTDLWQDPQNPAIGSNFGAVTVDVGGPGIYVPGGPVVIIGPDPGTHSAAAQLAAYAALLAQNAPALDAQRVQEALKVTADLLPFVAGKLATPGVVSEDSYLLALESYNAMRLYYGGSFPPGYKVVQVDNDTSPIGNPDKGVLAYHLDILDPATGIVLGMQSLYFEQEYVGAPFKLAYVSKDWTYQCTPANMATRCRGGYASTSTWVQEYIARSDGLRGLFESEEHGNVIKELDWWPTADGTSIAVGRAITHDAEGNNRVEVVFSGRIETQSGSRVWKGIIDSDGPTKGKPTLVFVEQQNPQTGLYEVVSRESDYYDAAGRLVMRRNYDKDWRYTGHDTFEYDPQTGSTARRKIYSNYGLLIKQYVWGEKEPNGTVRPAYYQRYTYDSKDRVTIIRAYAVKDNKLVRTHKFAYSSYGSYTESIYNTSNVLIAQNVRSYDASGAQTDDTRNFFYYNSLKLVTKRYVSIYDAAGSLISSYYIDQTFNAQRQLTIMVYRWTSDNTVFRKVTYYWENGRKKYETLYTLYGTELRVNKQMHRIYNSAGTLIRSRDYRCFYSPKLLCKEYDAKTGKLLRQTGSLVWIVNY